MIHHISTLPWKWLNNKNKTKCETLAYYHMIINRSFEYFVFKYSYIYIPSDLFPFYSNIDVDHNTTLSIIMKTKIK